jgi:hypothetical protein
MDVSKSCSYRQLILATMYLGGLEQKHCWVGSCKPLFVIVQGSANLESRNGAMFLELANSEGELASISRY